MGSEENGENDVVMDDVEDKSASNSSSSNSNSNGEEKQSNADADTSNDEKKNGDETDTLIKQEETAATTTATITTTTKEEEQEEDADTNADADTAADAAQAPASAVLPKQEETASPAPAPAAPATGTVAASPPPPVLRGTLSYNIELRRHLIRGMWNYENSNALPAQRFELIRNLEPEEDPAVLPKDGEFHGSFSLAYFHTTSKGKQKERSKVVPEHGVKIKFTKTEEQEGHFKVDGKGTNQFGIFHINGTATPTAHDDGQYDIVLRKRYEPASQPLATADAEGNNKTKKRKTGTEEVVEQDEGPFPPPSQSYEKNVVCLQGKVYKEESMEVGATVVVYRIDGMWSSGLDLILADPKNERGLCNRFEYEHKSSNQNATLPVSGRYSGWFDLNLEDGSKKKIVEKDVTLRFRKNDAGYHNVEGRGSNAFGKYSITGTLTTDNIITIFRHFQLKKSKTARPVTSAPPPINTPGQGRRPSLVVAPDPQLKLAEVKIPPGEEPMEALKVPEHSTYSAVSRGVLRLNDDGSLSCQGKWAVTREHFTNGQTSNFTFRLEAHFAAEALKKSQDRQFPLDSEMYKGSFQLKKGGSRYQTVIDQQIVMKFRKNTAGSYNVYGKGVNAIGVFNLTGTLILSGKTGGQVEFYRMYPPALLTPKPPANKVTPSQSVGKGLVDPSIDPSKSASALPGPPKSGLTRRESTRMVKMPSRLEDDDPTAQLQRIMDKCGTILRFIREKDVERGAFFSEPVDPVALGIPTYYQVIHEPMDLRTLARKMDAKEVTTPEDFARLARLVFENAMTFNVNPTHSVHQVARNLLILFNQKFRDVERMISTYRRVQQGEEGKPKGADKKRKRGDELRSMKRRRLDEAQEMAAANASSMAALASAVPRDPHASVTRNEFSLMLQMLTQMQQNIVQTHTALAELSSEEPGSGAIEAVFETGGLSVGSSIDSVGPAIVPERKKRKKPELKPVVQPVIEEDSRPLTLQEQELLTDTINELHDDHLPGVIQIIREAATISGEEEEIDLEIDQLDAVTQRKLLRHVSKFIKKPKRQKAKGTKKTKSSATASSKKNTPVKAEPVAVAKKDTDSFFAFGNKEDSDSDSEGEITTPAPAPAPEVPAAAAVGQKDFSLGDGYGLGNDEDSDNGEEMTNGTAAWTISQPTESAEKEADDDEGWAGAREKAAIAKVREEDKKKREEKLKAEAEQAKNQRLADAVAHGAEIKAQRQADEEEEARQREQQEKESEELRQRLRAEVRAQAESVTQTVDLESQRTIMRQYEQSFIDKEMGGASPSSDFGF